MELTSVLGEEDVRIFQLEELFCDFSAAWFFGPVYLKSFADEMSYYGIQSSQTHPPGHLRARFLMVSNSDMSKHHAYKALKSYFDLRDPGMPLPEDSVLKDLSSKFKGVLKSLNIGKFKPTNQQDLVAKSFEKNIPFVVSDVRTLINSLPPDDQKVSIDHYPELVSESLRKTNLLRQVKEYIREPDELFAIPGALRAELEGGTQK